jgi:hypothetical protein
MEGAFWFAKFLGHGREAAREGGRCRASGLAKLAASRHIEVVDATAESPRSQPAPPSTNLRYGCDRYAICPPRREVP